MSLKIVHLNKSVRNFQQQSAKVFASGIIVAIQFSLLMSRLSSLLLGPPAFNWMFSFAPDVQ